jgi:hypothetical protein
MSASTLYDYTDWGHSIMNDIRKSGDAITQPSTGYILKLLFMFISCIIMDIVMFNCCLNIHTCTWIFSLTTILKCLFNYGIKISSNSRGLRWWWRCAVDVVSTVGRLLVCLGLSSCLSNAPLSVVDVVGDTCDLLVVCP